MLVLQTSNLLSIASKRRFQSSFESLPSLIGIPKYLIGNLSSLHPKILQMKNMDKIFSPKHIRELLKLIFNSDHASKQYKVHLMITASLTSAFPKIKFSSSCNYRSQIIIPPILKFGFPNYTCIDDKSWLRSMGKTSLRLKKVQVTEFWR